MLEELAIKFISWNLKRKGINNLEIVIRSDGNTVYKRNKEKEEYVKKILSKIKWNKCEVGGGKNEEDYVSNWTPKKVNTCF